MLFWDTFSLDHPFLVRAVIVTFEPYNNYIRSGNFTLLVIDGTTVISSFSYIRHYELFIQTLFTCDIQWVVDVTAKTVHGRIIVHQRVLLLLSWILNNAYTMYVPCQES